MALSDSVSQLRDLEQTSWRRVLERLHNKTWELGPRGAPHWHSHSLTVDAIVQLQEERMDIVVED